MTQTSLFSAAPGSPLSALAGWFDVTLFGPLGTGLCVLGVAFVGYAMLKGHLPLQRAMTAVAGVSLLFGAPFIAAAFMGSDADQPLLTPSPMAEVSAQPPRDLPAASGDPYAGASLRRD